MSTTHVDAIGYLEEFAKTIDKPWLTAICTLVIEGKNFLANEEIDALKAILMGNASYLSIRATVASIAPAAIATGPSFDYLQELSDFSNFKQLNSTLRVTLEKRISIIFGANGSGKSSLCESLKVLANTESPSRPLHNAHAALAIKPEFKYKFQSDAAAQSWNETMGFGMRRSTVKYFDTGIAVKNVTNAVEPGRVIELIPFKLHIFESAKTMTSKLRDSLQSAKQANLLKLKPALENIRLNFARFAGYPLATIDHGASALLASEIPIGKAFTDIDSLNEKRNALTDLEKATSEDGLKTLKAEQRHLSEFLVNLKLLLTYAEEFWALSPVVKASSLKTKKATQEVLVEKLIPTGGSLESLMILISAITPLCKLEDASGLDCPACKRELGPVEVEYFKQYHALITSALEKEIVTLQADLTRASELQKKIQGINFEPWSDVVLLPEEERVVLKEGVNTVVNNCDLTREPSEEAVTALQFLQDRYFVWSQKLKEKLETITIAEKDRDQLVVKLAKLKEEIRPLEYAHAIHENQDSLQATLLLAEEDAIWEAELPFFTQLLKKLTETAKSAHENLVVGDFESRLDAEYQALTEKSMDQFGVKLVPKGSDASVTVLPQIGGNGINDILSEGEQRVHALALFFAELETCSHSVVVFDDPVSSFDYDYITNYCGRLRDFAKTHTNQQIIVFTHNWEFFVQLQKMMNKAQLDHAMSVQVLEGCSTVAEYTEKIDELKTVVLQVLNFPSEPSKSQKDTLAGNLRRLIEAIVNAHVFNNQHQQYKQRSNSVSGFHHYIKLVPLESTEAVALQDLFSKLSITEHDDSRACYTNTNKATFQARYDKIITIEQAIISRKP